MKKSEPKKIDRETYLKALALWTLSLQHYLKHREFECGLGDLLGYDPDDNYLGHLSDEVYSGGKFDTALRKEGFVVISRKKKP